MQDTSKREALIAVGVVLLASIVVLAIPQPKGKVYDCTLSEISPDYPLEVKEACRKLRAEMSNNNLHKPK